MNQKMLCRQCKLLALLMHVDTRTSLGTPWTNDVVPAWTDNIDLWQEQLVDLGVNGLTGEDSVQFRIRFKVGSGFGSDAAIDETTDNTAIAKISSTTAAPIINLASGVLIFPNSLNT